VSLKLKENVYVKCVRSAVLYASETLTMNAEQIGRFEWSEMIMYIRCVVYI